MCCKDHCEKEEQPNKFNLIAVDTAWSYVETLNIAKPADFYGLTIHVFADSSEIGTANKLVKKFLINQSSKLNINNKKGIIK